MSTEQTSSVPAGLSPRATVALLTLQLRASIQDAEAAEADLDAVDEEAAREQLRSRLAPLIDERRRALDDALAAVRAEAGAAVTAARAEGSAMIAEAEAEAVTRTTLPEVVQPDAVIAPPMAPSVVPPVVPSMVPPMVPPSAAQVSAPAPIQITVGFDAETFAHAFASVFATMLDERLGPPGAFVGRSAIGPAAAPIAPKSSFWDHARHLDALLLGLATTIVLVVLAAWLV